MHYSIGLLRYADIPARTHFCARRPASSPFCPPPNTLRPHFVRKCLYQGWTQTDAELRKLRQRHRAKTRELADVLMTLEKEEGMEKKAKTAQLWECAALQNFEQRNYNQQLVDTRRVNYFVQDNLGGLVENVYLPDVEPDSPRKSVFPLQSATAHPHHDADGQKTPSTSLWVPNPTFHKPVRRSSEHWFGAGGQTLESHAAYLEHLREEKKQPSAASFLLRRRPDAGSLPWLLLDDRTLPRAADMHPSSNVEALVTSR